jgi:hypothetical protein
MDIKYFMCIKCGNILAGKTDKANILCGSLVGFTADETPLGCGGKLNEISLEEATRDIYNRR